MHDVSPTVFSHARPYALNLRLAGKPVLVVGAGHVAVRKVSQLLVSGAKVTVVGPHVDSRLRDLAATSGETTPGSVVVEQRRYATGEVMDYTLALTCTDDPDVNRRVHDDGVTAGVWVNSADDPENCEFTLPSVVRTGDLQIAVSTEGRSPALAMYLRRRFEAEFDHRWAELLDVLADVRDEVRAHGGTSEVAGWQEAIDAGLLDLVGRGEIDAVRDHVREHVGLGTNAESSPAGERGRQRPKEGTTS